MTIIPEFFGQATFVMSGVNLPRGGVVTMGFSNTTGKTALACATDWWSLFAPIVVNTCSSDVQLSSVHVKLGPMETGQAADYTGEAAVGAVGATSLAPNTAKLITKNTAAGGRRYKGRCFLPGVPEGIVDDAGMINSTDLALHQARWNTLHAGAITADLDCFLLHAPASTWVINENGQPRRVPSASPPPAPTVITSFTCQPLVATQRRRLR